MTKRFLSALLAVLMVISLIPVAALAASPATFSKVDVVDGTDGVTPVSAPKIGQKLTANIVLADGTEIGSYPRNENVIYKWHVKNSDNVLGTDPVYTVTEDNLGKTICVTVTYGSTKTWEAAAAVGEIESVNVVDGTDGVTPVSAPKIDQKLTANIVLADGTEIGSYPRNDSVTYKWHVRDSDNVLGTDPVYTVTEDNLGKTICATVTYGSTKTWEAAAAVGEIESLNVVDGEDGFTPVFVPEIGQKLTANIVLADGTEIGSYPRNDSVTYKWHVKDSDNVLGTDPVYTVTEDNFGKTICVTAIYGSTEIWQAPVAVGAIESVNVVDGTDGVTPVTVPKIGQKLTANIILANGTEIGSYPVNGKVAYKWHYEGSDSTLGTDPVYTVTEDNFGKTICVTVTYGSTKTWKAPIAVGAIESVNVVDGTDGVTPVTVPKIGQKLTANIVLADGTEIGSYPVNEKVAYKWHYEGSDSTLGTDPVYTVTEDNLGKTICVTVTYGSTKTWQATASVGSYVIIATAGEGGSISPNGQVIVASGEEQTFNITPDENYSIADVKVDGVSQGKINNYTFSDVNKDGTIAVTFSYRKPTPPSGGNGGGTTTPTYEVKTPATVTGGTVTVSPARAAQGSTVTVTAAPSEGYEADTVTVTDANGNAIATTPAGEGRYTFTMPAGAVSVSASFKETGTPKPPVWQNPYSDVKEDDWYYDAVKYVTENGLMQGTGKDKFEPSTKLTRAMFAQILYNKAGKPAVTGTVNYKDFKAGQWYSDAIVWATQNKVLEGYSDGRVGVNDRITREQLALMLWRYVGKPEAPANVTIKGTVSSWAAEAMRWTVANGVINGDQNGNHDPRGTADRAQVAQILMNYYNK